MKIKKKSVNIIVVLFFALFSIIFTDTPIGQENIPTAIRKVGIATGLFLLLSIYQLYKIKKHILSFEILFLIFLFLFSYGQIFLYTIGHSPNDLSIFKESSYEEIYQASRFFLFCIISYHIGTLLVLNKPKNIQQNSIKLKELDKTRPSIRIVAIIMLVVSTIPYFWILSSKLRSSILLGYTSIYDTTGSSVSNIITYVSRLFIPSIFLLFYGINNKRIKATGIILLLIISAINFYIGARGDAISIIVILLTYYYSFEKELTKKSLIVIVAFTLITLVLIPAVATFRLTKNKSLDNLSETISSTTLISGDNNFITKTISELGASLNPIILTRRIIPSMKDYSYGESYISSVLMIIPSAFFGGYSFAEKAALDVWLKDTLKMTYGPGYSLFAETYYNFGQIGGILFCIILGIFFTKIFSLYERKRNDVNLYKMLSLIFLFNSLIIARFPFHMTIRNLIYMYLLPLLAIKIIDRKRINK